MRDFWLIARREIGVMLRRPTFYAATFGIPLLTGIMVFASVVLTDDVGVDPVGNMNNTLVGHVGYVDLAGLITRVPPELHPFFVPYPDEASAGAALQAQRIDAFFVVAPDYWESGRVVRVSRQATFTGATASDTRAFSRVLRENLVADPALARRLSDPLDLKMRFVGPDAARHNQQSAIRETGIALGLALLLAFGTLNGSGWLVQAVAEEKENRTIEVLLTSVRPWQLMAGKLLGLGTMSLLQLAVWVLLGRGFLDVGNLVAGSEATAVGASVWGWMILFFVLGFLFFGGLMMAFGAVGASVRESGQLSSLLTLPMLLPLWLAGLIIEQPNGVLALVLSLVPPTAPVTMMLRLGTGNVPPWQLALSVLLLLVSALGAITLAARLFRASTLLSGVRPTPRALWKALHAT